MIKVWKAIIDTYGHYSRSDILSLNYHYNPYQEMVNAVERAKRDQLEQVAERYDVSPKAVETAAEQLCTVEKTANRYFDHY